MKTRITELLGCEYPIIQGGMAWVAEHTLASAVSNAGGIGLIAGGSAPIDYLREQIRLCKEKTNKPFGVNIMLLSPHVDAVAKLAAEERVPVVTTGAGLPGKYMPAWIEAGVKVVPVVPSVAIARRVERGGATAVIAEGTESGGHVGELTTMALVPQVVDAVKIPVLAAGGIADGRGMAAAFMLGAEGVQCGTRFLSAFECGIHPNYKQKVLAARDIDTQVTGRRLGHPVRALRNPFVNKFAELERNPEVSDEELSAFGTGAVRKAAVDGNLQEGSFLAGQIAALVKKEQSAKEIVDEMMGEAERLLSGAGDRVF
jgi:enoyl-[acyl-carrier protein] reductase II